MNSIDWRSLSPGTELVTDGAVYEFVDLDPDDVVTLRSSIGLRETIAFPIEEARTIDLAVVPPPEAGEEFDDDDLKQLSTLSDRDRLLTLERMVYVGEARKFRNANPNATQHETAEYAKRNGDALVDRMLYPHARRSGLKFAKAGFSVRTIEHYLLQFRLRGFAGLISKECGSGRRTIKPRQSSTAFVALAMEIVDDWRDGRQLQKAQAWLAFVGLVKRKYGDAQPQGMISRRTFERWLSGLPVAETVAGRCGEKVADDLYTQRGVREKPQRALQQVEMDAWYAPIECVDDDLLAFCGIGEVRSFRPTVIMAVCRKTRAIVSWGVFAGAPNQEMTQRVVVDAFKDRRAFLASCSVVAEPLARGGVEQFLTDGGGEFSGMDARTAYALVGADYGCGVAGVPHHRGNGEGIFNICMAFMSWLPGQLGRNPVDRGRRGDDGGQRLSLGELRKWMAVWIEDIYHGQVSFGSHGLSPREAFLRDRDMNRPLPVPKRELLVAARQKSFVHKVGRAGIRFENNYYKSQRLNELVRTHGNVRVEGFAWHDDIGSISVKLDGELVDVPNTDRRCHGVSLDHWRAVNAAFIMRGRSIERAGRDVVVDAALRLRNRMADYVREGEVPPVLNFSKSLLDAIDDASTSGQSPPTTRPGPSLDREGESRIGRAGIDLGQYGRQRDV